MLHSAVASAIVKNIWSRFKIDCGGNDNTTNYGVFTFNNSTYGNRFNAVSAANDWKTDNVAHSCQFACEIGPKSIKEKNKSK